MNPRTKALVALWIICTAVLAWAASIENPYLAGLPAIEDIEEYYWQYPVLFAVVGAGSIVAIRPWKSEHSRVGALLVFAVFAALVVLLAISTMHSAPVHGILFYMSLGMSQAALFYSGFVFAKQEKMGKND